jgi:hypothetical protein
MRNLGEYYSTRDKREKALIWTVVTIATLVLFYYSYIFVAYGDQETKGEIKDKLVLLRKFEGLLSREEVISADASSLKDWGGVKLIKGTQEGQVLSEIPRLIKKISAESDLVVSKSDVIRKEVLHKDPKLLLLEVAVEVEDVHRAEELQKFLYLLENNEDFTCYVKELKLKELDDNRGVSLYVALDIYALVNR